MNLDVYFKSLDITGRENMAAACGTTVDYLVQLKGGHRKPSHTLAKKIEKYTKGKVTRSDLRPDIFELTPSST